MQSPLIEIRSANGTACGAYELRSGVRVGWNDVEARLLAMGCPRNIARRSAERYQRQVDGRSAPNVDPGLVDLDAVRDWVNRWELSEISRVVEADKAAGRI